MRGTFLKYANRLHHFTGYLCVALLSVLIATEILIVALRMFSVGFLWLQDLGQYAFALLIMFAIPYAVRLDRHVRVDIFRKMQTDPTRSKIDVASFVVLLFPLFAVIVYLALPDLIYSWSIGERSPQIGGLPFYYVVKTGVVLACVLICVQGFAWLFEVRGGQEQSD